MVVVKSGPGVRGFCAIPHGALSVVPMIFAGAAFTLNLIAGLNCKFIERLAISYSYSAAAYDDEGNVTHIDLDEHNHRWMYGLRQDGCYGGVGAEFEDTIASVYFNNLYYTDELTDDEKEMNPFNLFTDPDYNEQTEDRFRAATASVFLAVLIGGMTMLFIWLGTCIAYNRIVRIMMGCFFGLASVFAFTSLTVFSADMCEEDVCLSDYRNQTRVKELDLDIPLDEICTKGCRLGPGAGCAVIAGFFWMIAAIVNCVLKNAPDDEATNKTPATTATMTRQLEEREPLTTIKEDLHYQQEEQAPGTPPLSPTPSSSSNNKRKKKKKRAVSPHSSDEGLSPVPPMHHYHVEPESTNIENMDF